MSEVPEGERGALRREAVSGLSEDAGARGEDRRETRDRLSAGDRVQMRRPDRRGDERRDRLPHLRPVSRG